MDVQTRIGMPLDEFIREYDKAPFELVNGERIPVVPTVAIHGEIIRVLVMLLAKLNGIVFYTDTPFVRDEKSDWVRSSRVPNLMAYRVTRWTDYKNATPDWRERPFALIPDLCVEVVSKTDNYEDVDDKVAEYLQLGVSMVWVIKPRSEVITVHVAERVQRLTARDLLTGGDVLPGFSVPVADVFPKA